MNIAMVVYSHYSRDARVRRYAEALVKHGFCVDVICLKENYIPKNSNISLVKYPLPRKRLGRLWYILEYFLFFCFSTFWLAINSFVKKYKTVHIHNMPDFLVFTATVPKLFGSKIILDLHDIMPELYMSKYRVNYNNFVVKLLILIEKLSFVFADKIITANSEFKKIFLKRHKFIEDKIKVILNCPDTNIFKPTTNTSTSLSVNNQHFDFAQCKQPTTIFTLLYMGTVEERFGLDIAIEAVPNLIQKIPQLRFLIIPKLEDEGKYFSLLKRKIESLNLSNHILILNPLPLEKIAEKLKEVDIGIVLAKNGIFTDSIVPVKLLEFVQMGVPVIATKTEILTDSFVKNAIYFLEKNTPDEFEKAVLTLWKNKKLRKELAKNAKKFLIKNNWKNEKKKYLKLTSSFCQ